MANSKLKIQNEFNCLAESLGCRARIGGTPKKCKFFEWRNGVDKGYEVWFPITAQRFVALTQSYKELVNF